MNQYEMERICKQAVKTFGIDIQQILAMEEMAELTQAISKRIRGFKQQANVAEEIADVEIMLEQLKQGYKCHEEVERWKAKKLARLEGRISQRGIKGDKV